MKKLNIIFFLLLGLVTEVQAQDIVGKWKCSKEILDRLNLGYEVINGYYTFSKNGKFKLKIKGSIKLEKKKKKSGVPLKELKRMNPALIKGCTPPKETWILKVPYGQTKEIAKSLKSK